MATQPPPGLGWVPDLPDQRDMAFQAALEVIQNLPAAVDLRGKCPLVYDQGRLGSCTANAIAGALEFDAMKQGLPQVTTPSRLFIYYNERVMEGSVNSDAGAQIRDGIKSVGKQGACPEVQWPYDASKLTVKPSEQCYADAALHKAVAYQRIGRTLTLMKGCLASGYPFVFGFAVYESFMSAQVADTGIVPMPQSSERREGGHAVAAVGYDDAQQRFIVRNSWGAKWGMKGYCTMPYTYLLSELADDFWYIRTVQGK